MQPQDPLVFISYATPDRERVRPYVDYLIKTGLNVWIDFQQLKAGQKWDLEIKRALNKADFVIVFFSNNSIDRRGYVQREIKFVLDKLEEKLTSDIYLIPLLLDEGVSIPESVSDIHCIRSWIDDPYMSIVSAINHQLAEVGAAVKAVQEKSKISWSRRLFKEKWEGLPGYETEIALIDLSSSEYVDIRYASDYFNALLLDFALNMRDAKLSQEAGIYNFGHDKQLRTNTLDGGISDPIIAGKILSLRAALDFYFAGAAHGNMSFRTTAFILDPLIRIPSLQSIFLDEKAAFPEVSRLVRESLINNAHRDEDGVLYGRDADWVAGGTGTWESLKNFVFQERNIEILFPPYQVDCFAAGPQFASVEYKDILNFLRPEFAAALDLSPILGDPPAWLDGKEYKQK